MLRPNEPASQSDVHDVQMAWAALENVLTDRTATDTDCRRAIERAYARLAAACWGCQS